jgi:hypothetical protein
MTVGELLKMRLALRDLGNHEIKVSSAYTASRIALAFEKEHEAYDKQHNALIDRLGVEDTSPNGRRKKRMLEPSNGGDKEKWEQFFSEVEQLRSHQIEVTIPELRVSDLTDYQGNEVSVPHRILTALDKVLLPPK